MQDTQALRKILLKAEADSQFLQTLETTCKSLANTFTVDSERQGWADLLHDMGI